MKVSKLVRWLSDLINLSRRLAIWRLGRIKLNFWQQNSIIYKLSFWRLIFRPNRIAAYCYSLQMSNVAWSVCLFVCWSQGCAVHKRLNPSRCHSWADSCVPEELDGGRDPTRERTILGVVRPTEKQWESLLRCTQRNKRKHSMLNSSTTAGLLQPIGPCHITLFPMKNPPPAMRPVVKILRPLSYSFRFNTALDTVVWDLSRSDFTRNVSWS